MTTTFSKSSVDTLFEKNKDHFLTLLFLISLVGCLFDSVLKVSQNTLMSSIKNYLFSFKIKKNNLCSAIFLSFLLLNSPPVNAEVKLTKTDIHQRQTALYETRFFKPIVKNKLNEDAAKKCLVGFEKLCGKPDLPTSKDYIYCLQSKFKFVEKACEDYAHSLIHMNFLATLPEKVSQCQILIEDCREKNPTTTISQCFETQKTPPDVCVKLTFDFLFYRTLMSKLFNLDFKTNPKKQSYQ